MATLDEILPEAKALAQLRLANIVGQQEQERVDSVRRAAVKALETRARVWLLTGQQEVAGYFVSGDNGPSTINLQDFVNDIAEASYQNADGTTTNLPVDKIKLFERIEKGRRVIKVMPVDNWPVVDLPGQGFSVTNQGVVLLKMKINVGATAQQVTDVLNLGWETYLRLMLSGYYDSRYQGMQDGEPLDHATAEREAEGLKLPMAV